MTEDLAEFEATYRSRLAEGLVRWHPGDFEDFEMRPFLDQMIRIAGGDLAKVHVLDLGCGTGQVSCYLAAHGAIVTGIDCSPAAIESAMQQSCQRGFSIDFRVGDLRTMELYPDSYELVIDCHFLHCIVNLSQRADMLRRIYTVLIPGGELWSETMVGIPKIRSGDNYILDPEGVFWKELPDGIYYHQAIEHEGKVLSPIRRIHPCVDGLNHEFSKAGFMILTQEREVPVDDTSVSMVKTRLRKPA